jgi:hypothetical protein
VNHSAVSYTCIAADAGPEDVTASDTILDCSSSGDGNCDAMGVVDVTALINDSKYPADYIMQRNAWIATYNACTWWMGNKITLNLQNYRATQAFQIPNSNNWLWLGGLWNRGEPLCANSLRQITTFECVPMLETVIKSCDNSTATTPKNGGSKMFDCIVWVMEITDGMP